MTGEEPHMEPSTSELMRRLDEVARMLSGLTREMREDRIAAEAKFVPRELHASDMATTRMRQAEVEKDVAKIETEREHETSWRRTSSLTLAVAAVGWILTIATLVLTVVTFR